MYSEETKRQLCQKRLQGYAVTELAKEFRVSETTAALWLRKANIKIGATERSRELSSKGERNGHNQFCLEEPEQHFAKLVEDKTNGRFQYVGGYTGCDSPVLVRCNICGCEFTNNAQLYRPSSNGNIRCPGCRKQKIKRKADEKTERAELRAIAKAKQIELSFAECNVCGTMFVPSKELGHTYCSVQCKHKAINRKKDHRLNADNIIDKDITLEKLYKRDSGVCYLCGKVCDWNDFVVADGTTICGDLYPSIEHVYPLCEGGKHSWENVKLACRGCNTKKNKKIIISP